MFENMSLFFLQEDCFLEGILYWLPATLQFASKRFFLTEHGYFTFQTRFFQKEYYLFYVIYNVLYFAGKLLMKRTTVWKTAACESNTCRRKKGVINMCIESCTETSTDFCIVKWGQIYPILSRTSLPFRHCVIKDQEFTDSPGNHIHICTIVYGKIAKYTICIKYSISYSYNIYIV